MKNIGNESFAINPLTLVVRGALVVMFGVPALALAQGTDQSVEEILKPTNFVEIGATNVGTASTKFGEYNGLQKDGGTLIGNFSIKGGNAYGAGDGTRRWEINGSDLGTSNRTLDAKIGDQGQWNLGIGYDELRHYTPGPFMTPLVGNAGANNFTLPAGFGAVNTGAPGTRGLTAAQYSLFKKVDDLYSGRKNTNVTAGYQFDKQWGINFEYNRLTQTGAKLMSAGTMQQGPGGAAGAAGAVGGGTFTGEAVMTVMNPTEYKTDTVKLSLDWKGDNGHLSGGYYGSFFRDQYTGFSWTSPLETGLATAAPFVGNINQMSTAPDNNFHQLNLSGGYAIRSTTKLTGGFSYGRNTQNDSYLIDPVLLLGGVSPQNSLNGLVKTTHADLKLIDTSIKDLTLSAGFKYNKRDNETPSASYSFYDIGHATLRTIANAPYSNKKVQVELAGDYRLAKGQTLRLSYERENIDRWCNSLARTTLNAGNQNGNNPYGSTDCVVYPHSEENKINAGYKIKMDNGVALKAGLFWAVRMTDENHLAVGPLGATSVVPTYGTQAYVNNGDGYGFKPFFEAQRKEQGVKLGGSWEATEQLSVQADGRYSRVRYPDSIYGTQNGETATANLDATYAISESSTVTAWGSRQLKTRFMHDNANSTTNWALSSSRQEWNSKLTDNETAIGVSGKIGGLLGNKLDLKYDFSKSSGSYAQLTENLYQGATCGGSGVLTCGYLPEVITSIITFKLEGDYKLDKASSVRIGYLFKRVMNNDYIYNIYQQNLTPNATMPTNQLPPRYSVNAVGASYIYSFK